MIELQSTHTFTVPVAQAYAYITDLKNWPDYWPNFIRLENAAQARWQQPGDQVALVMRLVGRPITLNMHLNAITLNRIVKYTSRQEGLPDIHHERHFLETPSGQCEYRLVVNYEPRPGLSGIFDRVIFRRSVLGAFQKTNANLDAIFQIQKK